MAKTTLWQWSSTAASNTDINSIDITGATGLVKNGDNAMREMMAQLAASEAKGSNVASASTVALGTGRFFHITGTTTITDIDFTDAVDGRWAVLEFDGALTLTHNATTLTLPGGANITTAAGDRAFIVQDSGDNVHVLFYQPYSTRPYGIGTATNDSAGAGYIGEVLSGTRASGSATSATNNTALDVTSVSLTAGDWEVSGSVSYTTAATTVVTRVIANISQTSATRDTSTAGAESSIHFGSGVTPTALNGAFALNVGPIRISLAATTTIYLVGFANFTTSTLTAYGSIRARRLR